MGDSTSPGPVRTTRTLVLRNERDSVLTVVLEPWATEYQLAPQEVLGVVENGGASAEKLEIHVEADHVVFSARSGSTLHAFRDGVELP